MYNEFDIKILITKFELDYSTHLLYFKFISISHQISKLRPSKNILPKVHHIILAKKKKKKKKLMLEQNGIYMHNTRYLPV